MNEKTSSPGDTSSTEIFDLDWMIRPCEQYRDEYVDCKSIKARFHQYYIFGEMVDCSQWKIDYNNCNEWVEHKSRRAYNELITSERARRLRRLKGHVQNDIWERRDKPPENWNAPLPDWLIEKNKKSYLRCAKEHLKNNQNNEMPKNSCTIM